jgi:CIC family chloride channel protein
MRQLTLQRLRQFGATLGFGREWYLIPIAMVIGLVMGAVAVAFILPLRWIEEWATTASRDQLLWVVPLAPLVGALLAGIVIYLLRGDARGPGVSAVIYSIHRRKSNIPARIGVRKWIASTLTIGSGGSAGAEGPIVTIGSVIGSNIGHLFRTNPQNTATLLGCGAAAGIAAVFNAPIAGIFFVLEILLRDFSLRTFTPIVIAAVVAAAGAQAILTSDPIFFVEGKFFQEYGGFNLMHIPNFLMLGLLCGIVAALFIRGLFMVEGAFARLPVHDALRPATGGACLGLLGLVVIMTNDPESGAPKFYGNGYPVIESVLEPSNYINPETGLISGGTLIFMLAILAIGKGLATCLTIGSGGAGGLFAPSLLIGASVGGAFGCLVNELQWFPAANPASYALVGMGAMVAATTHAPLTAILLVYELTRSHETILPLMLAAVISTVVGRLVYRESVYTVKLTQRGLRLGAMSDLTILRRLAVQDVPLQEAVAVHPDDSAQRLLQLSETHLVSDFIAIDTQNCYCGLVTAADLKAALVYREAIPLLQVSELLRNDLPTVTMDEPLDVVLDKFSQHDVQSLAVLDDDGDGSVRGLITRQRLMKRYQQALDNE